MRRASNLSLIPYITGRKEKEGKKDHWEGKKTASAQKKLCIGMDKRSGRTSKTMASPHKGPLRHTSFIEATKCGAGRASDRTGQN